MRNTKLILAMLAGCTVMSASAFAQDAAQKADKSATPTQTSSDSMKSGNSSSSAASSDSMKSGDSMKSDDSMKSNDSGSMKSTHKKTHKKAATGDTSAPAKSSSSGM